MNKNKQIIIDLSVPKTPSDHEYVIYETNDVDGMDDFGSGYYFKQMSIGLNPSMVAFLRDMMDNLESSNTSTEITLSDRDFPGFLLQAYNCSYPLEGELFSSDIHHMDKVEEMLSKEESNEVTTSIHHTVTVHRDGMMFAAATKYDDKATFYISKEDFTSFEEYFKLPKKEKNDTQSPSLVP